MKGKAKIVKFRQGIVKKMDLNVLKRGKPSHPESQEGLGLQVNHFRGKSIERRSCNE